jgi:hypothetical protein
VSTSAIGPLLKKKANGKAGNGLAKAITKSRQKPFVPFAGDPASQRPNKQQTKDEINAIRGSGLPDSTESNWMNDSKVAARTNDTI